MIFRRLLLAVSLGLFFCNSPLFCQGNGKLQIHFIDVGQGDGALLISPQGQTVLFDGGVLNKCDKPLSYLEQLGVAKIDYLIVSHYHSDHIGCTPQELQAFPLQKEAIDRGFSYTTTAYTDYVNAVQNLRTSLTSPGREIVLDAATATPVKINVVVVDGVPLHAAPITTDNENDLSLSAVITYGRFKAEIGGDLSGVASVRFFGSNRVEYKDIESSVAPDVGPLDVYKVHHHCSAYSSNQNWLAATHPTIAIVSAGDGNTYGHPTPECLQRLHDGGVKKTYWTELGAGQQPLPGLDVVAGNIIVEVAAPPNDSSFTVTYDNAQPDTFAVLAAGGGSAGPGPSVTPPTKPIYAWSKKAHTYHFITCDFVRNISAKNLETGAKPPAGKSLHAGCPSHHGNAETTDPSDVPR